MVKPPESVKPPFPRKSLCYIIANSLEIQKQNNFEIVKWGYSKDVVEKSIKYLAEHCFVPGYNEKLSLKENVLHLTVEESGRELLNAEKKKNKNYAICLRVYLI